MEKNWVKVYTTPRAIEAEIIMQVLLDHEVEVVKMNKQDSMYQVFGEVELYVHQSKFDQAIEIIIHTDIEGNE